MAAYSESVLSVLKDKYFPNNQESRNLEEFVNVSNYTHLFSLQNVKSIEDTVTHVNSLLNSASSRCDGLLLLKALATQSSSHVYAQYEKSWRASLLKILQSRDTATTYSACCDVIGDLLTFSVDLPQSNRDISNNYLPQLLPSLLNASPQWIEPAIKCINVCMRKHPAPTGTFRAKIEQLILPLTDDPTLLNPLSRCYGLLAQSGSGGTGGIKHSQGWSTKFDSATAELHNAYVFLVADLELANVHIKLSGLALPSLPEVEPSRAITLLHRIRYFTRCCVILLTQDFPVAVKVPIRPILQLLAFMMDADATSLLSRPTTALLTLAAYMPMVHGQCMKLLSALIMSCRSLLVPYTAQVNKMLVQTLVWTHQEASEAVIGQQHTFSSLRCEVYGTLLVWMTHLGYSCYLDNDVSDLITEIMSDVKPLNPSLKIQSTGTKDTQQSHKKKKRGHFHELKEGGTGDKVDQLANHQVCTKALKVLRQLLHTVGTRMKTKHLQSVQSFAISMCVRIQQCGTTTPYPAPYSDPSVRKQLYRVLLAVTMVIHPTWPPPIQLAVRLLEIGCRDQSVKVASFCSEAYGIMELMIHPRIPCIQPAVRLSEPCLHVDINDVYQREDNAAEDEEDDEENGDGDSLSKDSDVGQDMSENKKRKHEHKNGDLSKKAKMVDSEEVLVSESEMGNSDIGESEIGDTGSEMEHSEIGDFDIDDSEIENGDALNELAIDRVADDESSDAEIADDDIADDKIADYVVDDEIADDEIADDNIVDEEIADDNFADDIMTVDNGSIDNIDIEIIDDGSEDKENCGISKSDNETGDNIFEKLSNDEGQVESSKKENGTEEMEETSSIERKDVETSNATSEVKENPSDVTTTKTTENLGESDKLPEKATDKVNCDRTSETSDKISEISSDSDKLSENVDKNEKVTEVDHKNDHKLKRGLKKSEIPAESPRRSTRRVVKALTETSDDVITFQSPRTRGRKSFALKTLPDDNKSSQEADSQLSPDTETTNKTDDMDAKSGDAKSVDGTVPTRKTRGSTKKVEENQESDSQVRIQESGETSQSLEMPKQGSVDDMLSTFVDAPPECG